MLDGCIPGLSPAYADSHHVNAEQIVRRFCALDDSRQYRLAGYPCDIRANVVQQMFSARAALRALGAVASGGLSRDLLSRAHQCVSTACVCL